MTPEERHFRTLAPLWLRSLVKAGVAGFSNKALVEFISHPEAEESVVAKITGGCRVLIAKLARVEGVVAAEAAFLAEWHRLGARVPQVVDLLPPTEFCRVQVLLLEYIPHPLLATAMTLRDQIECGVARARGRLLAHLHRATGSGYGRPRSTDPHVGQCRAFAEEMSTVLASSLLGLVQQRVIEEDLLSKAENAIATLERQEGKPSLTHGDFRAGNIFIARDNDLIAFDPNTRITHPAMCLAFTLIRALTDTPDYGKEECKEVLCGYREIGSVSDEALQAALVLRGLMVLRTWVRKGKWTRSRILANLIRDMPC